MKIFVPALLILATSAFSQMATEQELNLEIRNKGNRIYVKIKNGGVFIEDGKAFPVEAKQTMPFPVDSKKETELYIYTVRPTSGTTPEKVYTFDLGKTMFVTWDGKIAYPQTGPLKGVTARTKSGRSLRNNVIVNKKVQEMRDITREVELQARYALLLEEAGKEREEAKDMNQLWKKWCDPSGEPEHPDSLFCAAGWGNDFALLMLRIRFIVPRDADNDFDPSQHVFKMIARNLPQKAGSDSMQLNPQALFLGFFPKIDEGEAINWKEFNAFVKPVKRNPALGDFLHDVMSDYGLSTQEQNSAGVRKQRAITNDSSARRALGEELSFPTSSIIADGERRDLNEVRNALCGGRGKWQGTLYCAIAEGNTSALYFAAASFVPPRVKERHAVKMILTAISDYATGQGEKTSWWDSVKKKLTGNVALPLIRRQLSEAISEVEKGGSQLTWEKLRNVFKVANMTVTEWVPSFANGSLKGYGLEIAPL